MPKKLLVLNNFQDGLNIVKDPRDIKFSELRIAQNIMLDRMGMIRTMGAKTTHSDAGLSSHASTASAGYGLFYFEGDKGPSTTVTKTDIQFNNGAGSNVIYQSDPADDLYTNFGAGDVIKVSGSTSNDGLYEVLYKDSSVGWWGIVVDRNLTTEAAGATVTVKKHSVGEKYIALADADNGNIDIWTQSTDSWSTAEIILASGVNLTSAISPVFYFVDGALRASDSNWDNTSDVKWYGFVERVHFADANGDSTTSSDVFLGFYENDNKLSPPTAGDYKNSVDYTGLSGDGFNIYPAESSDDGDWDAKIWEFAETFIYDGNQESLLKVMSSTFDNSAGNDGRKMTIAVAAKKSYNERVSGGRIYIREYQSDDPWILFADINLTDGVRVSLDSTYTTWTDAGSGQFNVQNLDSVGPNLDTFETINGYPHDIVFNSIGETGAGYKCATVAGRRAFIANMRINEVGTSITVYGDRIMYSEVNKFDTFPATNFIDVTKGDAEEYTAITSFADRLFAFKHKTLHIINIASPSPTDWFLESQHHFMGVDLPASVVKTEFGIAWVNKYGCYFYDGTKITNLISGKIREDDKSSDPKSWDDFINSGSIIGFQPKDKQLIVLDNTSATTGDIYLYDFKTKSWVFGDSRFSASIKTNFAVDHNGDLIIGEESATNVVVSYWNNDDQSQSANKIIAAFKDIDFGAPGRIKKIYRVMVTYQSTAAQTDPIKYATDGGTSFSSAFTGNFINTAGAWDILNATVTPFECQSLSIEITNPTNSGQISINDITIEYREIYKRVS